MGKTAYKIVLILLVAFIVRLINFNQSFWLDEAAQMVMSQKPLLFQWVGRANDFHPPLYYLFMHLWLGLGRQEWFLRLPSVIFGVGMVYLSYVFTRKLFNEKTALLSALFLAIAPFHIYYSQEARMYSFFAFLATLSMFLFWLRRWNYYLIVTTAMLYTHYSSFFVILAQLIWIIFKEREIFKNWGENLTIALLLFIPWLPQFIKQLRAGEVLLEILPAWQSVASLSPIKALPLLFFKFSLGRISFDNKIVYLLVMILIIVTIGFTFWNGLRRLSREKLFLVNWLFIPVIGTWTLSLYAPMFQPFRLLFVVVPFYILLVVGIIELSNLSRQKLAVIWIMFISLAGLSMYYVNPKYQREDWKKAVQLIESKPLEKTVAIFEFSAPLAPYEWYSRGRVRGIGALGGLKAIPEKVEQKMNLELSGTKDVYLFEYLQPLTDPQRLVEKWLNENGYRLKLTMDVSGVGFVYHFRRCENDKLCL